MKHIRFKRSSSPGPYDFDKVWIAELRTYLPKEFKKVNDDELARAYSEWSEANFCASWLSTDRETAANFASDIELVDEEFGWGSLALAFFVGVGLTCAAIDILTMMSRS